MGTQNSAEFYHPLPSWVQPPKGEAETPLFFFFLFSFSSRDLPGDFYAVNGDVWRGSDADLDSVFIDLHNLKLDFIGQHHLFSFFTSDKQHGGILSPGRGGRCRVG